MGYFARVVWLLSGLWAGAAGAVTVVASLPPLGWLAGAVMAGVGQPVVLLDGRQSPHGFSLTPAQRAALSRADLVLWVGPDMESWLARPLAQQPGRALAMVDVPGVSLLPASAYQAHRHGHAHGAWDMHLWTDVLAVQGYVEALRDELVLRDPVNARHYQDNAQRLLASIAAADAQAMTLLRAVQSRPLLVFHDAWRYFFRRYGLTLAGVIQVSPDQPALVGNLSEVYRALAQGQVQCLLREPQFEPRALASLRAEAPGLREALTDPLGGVDQVDGYAGWLLAQARAIHACAVVR